MLTSNLKLISQFNALKSLSRKADAGFVESLCEFLVEEFQFQSAIVFRVNESNKLVVLGKSASARKSFLVNGIYDCATCRFLKGEGESFDFHSDTACELRTNDFVNYESCLLVKGTAGERYLLKLARKTPFTKAEKEFFGILGNFVADLLADFSGGSSPAALPLASVVATVANEIRTPVNSILGFTTLLNDGKLASSQSEYVLNIKDNTQRLGAIANDLIDMAKTEAGLSGAVFTSVTPGALLSDVFGMFSDKLDKNTFSFEMAVDRSIGDAVKLDIQKCKFILSSVISHLVALATEAKVAVTVAPVGKSKLNFKVALTGTVNPAGQIKNLFSPQFSAELKTGKPVLGTPLSLPLAKKYIDLLEGETEIASIPGKGITVGFTVRSEMLSTIENQISALPKPDGKSKVLVIEDDYATSKLLSNYLNKWGYEPSIVNTGGKALQVVQKEKYLAIIMDIVLPDINGLELLKKLHEQESTKHTPIIVCSVESEQQKAFMLGAVEYFVKPIKYKDLVEVLTSYKLKKDSNVLCVDDDVPTLNLIKSAIDSVGYNAIAESDSTKVMALIKDVPVDLAIVDLDMPDINGFELIKLIKSVPRFANLPIIIYTGKENFQEDLRKIDGLFTDLLDKRSTKIEDLADTINAMINRYEEPTPPEEVVNQPATEPKILLVEDYKHSQIIVTRLLKKNNFNSIVVVENGAEAIEQVKGQRFDLILMDMQMPVMNGFEATERIRQIPDYKDVPIIALTAFAMKGDREKCIEAGATDYIPKPIDSSEFIEKVKHYTLAG